MKIKFIKPLPRLDHVILPGQVLDAPDGFARKMIRTRRAIAVTGEGDGSHDEVGTEKEPAVEETAQEAGAADPTVHVEVAAHSVENDEAERSEAQDQTASPAKSRPAAGARTRKTQKEQ
ncbi:MAG: hypothetical protein J6N77_05450 [Lachnospiraceae bacterium]|nr:hypothetical protein [Lachnospiraceae bacterium]